MNSKDNIGGPNMDQSWIGRVVVRILILALLVTIGMSLLLSCCQKMMPSHDDSVNHKDSTSVTIITKDSLVYAPIPLEKDQVIAHVGDTSNLETSVAKSTAFIGADGFLHHSLENKSEEKLPVVVPIPIKTIFNGVTHTEVHTLTKYAEVERQPSWWEKFRLRAFWWLVAALGAALLWIFRKQILKLFGVLI